MLAAYLRHYWKAASSFIAAHPFGLAMAVGLVLLWQQTGSQRRDLITVCATATALPDAHFERFARVPLGDLKAMRKVCDKAT